jgi:branched-chain amino acid transport system substrate-binding protein
VFVGDLTGPTKFYGMQDLLGLESVAAYYNDHGGIGGRHIVITKLSDNGDPTTAVSVLLQYLSSHPKPDWVYGGTESDETAALVPVFKREHLLGGGLGAIQCYTTADKDCPTQFFDGGPPTASGAPIANYILQHHFKKAGFLLETLDTCNPNDLPAAAQLKAAGIPTKTVTFPITALSVTPEVQELKASGADVMVVCAFGPPTAYAAKARSALAWNAHIVYDLAAASSDLTKLIPASDLSDSVEEIFRPMNACLSLQSVDTLLSEAKQFGGYPEGGLLDTAAFAWDEIVQVHNAAAQAGSTDQAALINALINLNSTAQTDPLLLLNAKFKYTNTNHANELATAADFYMVAPAPVVNGQVSCASGSASSSSSS